MVATTKIPDFIEGALEAEHNIGADTLQIALSITAPASESSNPTVTGNGVLANVTQIAYTNYTDSLGTPRVLDGVTSVESGGTYTFDASDFSITASGGAIANFRYIYIFNQTSVTPDDQLVLLIDLETTVALADASSININFNASGIITIA